MSAKGEETMKEREYILQTITAKAKEVFLENGKVILFGSQARKIIVRVLIGTSSFMCDAYV